MNTFEMQKYLESITDDREVMAIASQPGEMQQAAMMDLMRRKNTRSESLAAQPIPQPMQQFAVGGTVSSPREMSPSDIVSDIERRKGMPPGSLRAIWQIESSQNTDLQQLGPKTKYGRARGPFQMLEGTMNEKGKIPETFRGHAERAADYLIQGAGVHGWDNAPRFYQGGPNTKIWGKNNDQYLAKYNNIMGKDPIAASAETGVASVPYTGDGAPPAQMPMENMAATQEEAGIAEALMALKEKKASDDMQFLPPEALVSGGNPLPQGFGSGYGYKDMMGLAAADDLNPKMYANGGIIGYADGDVVLDQSDRARQIETEKRKFSAMLGALQKIQAKIASGEEVSMEEQMMPARLELMMADTKANIQRMEGTPQENLTPDGMGEAMRADIERIAREKQQTPSLAQASPMQLDVDAIKRDAMRRFEESAPAPEEQPAQLPPPPVDRRAAPFHGPVDKNYVPPNRVEQPDKESWLMNQDLVQYIGRQGSRLNEAQEGAGFFGGLGATARELTRMPGDLYDYVSPVVGRQLGKTADLFSGAGESLKQGYTGETGVSAEDIAASNMTDDSYSDSASPMPTPLTEEQAARKARFDARNAETDRRKATTSYPMEGADATMPGALAPYIMDEQAPAATPEVTGLPAARESVYGPRLDKQYNRSVDRQGRQSAADLAYRKAAYAKRKGLSALPGNHGLAREAKNEMAALGLDQTQRNLDRGFDRSMFNDTSDLVNQGLLFEDRGSRSDTFRLNAVTGAKNAETNASRSGLGAAKTGMTEAQAWNSLSGITDRIAEVSDAVFTEKQKLATYDMDNGGRDAKPEDLVAGKRALQSRIDTLNAELQNATAQRDMFHERLGLRIQNTEVADRPAPIQASGFSR